MLGIITGLKIEARVLKDQEARGLLRTGVAGADQARAKALAESVAKAGARGLVSFGICGGLVPHFKVGQLVLPQAVRHPDGRDFPTHEGWRQRLAAALTSNRRVVRQEGTLVGSPVLVEKPADKKALHHASGGAIAVDMESHAVGEAAALLGLPFLVIRTCSDGSEHPFPMEALTAMRPDGSFGVLPVIKSLAFKPWIGPKLVKLAWDTRLALDTLEEVAKAEAALTCI